MIFLVFGNGLFFGWLQFVFFPNKLLISTVIMWDWKTIGGSYFLASSMILENRFTTDVFSQIILYLNLWQMFDTDECDEITCSVLLLMKMYISGSQCSPLTKTAILLTGDTFIGESHKHETTPSGWTQHTLSHTQTHEHKHILEAHNRSLQPDRTTS